MKKTSILTIMMAFIAMSTFAQTPAPATPQQRPMPSPEERAKGMTERLNKEVQLTPEQYAKVLNINKDFETQRTALMTPGQPMSDDAKAKMRTLSKEKQDKIDAVLTAEQKTKLQDARKRPNGMNGAPGAPAPATGK